MKIRSLVAAVAFATAGTAAAAPVYSPVTGHWYDYVNRDIADVDYTTWSWEEARVDAQARSYLGMRGHLVTLTSAQEEQVLIDNWFGDILYGQPWIGGFRAPNANYQTGWQWVTGEPFVYTNWFHCAAVPSQPCSADEPNNSGGAEYFLHYRSYNVASTTQWDGWGWNDASASYRAGYFIEYQTPEPETLALAALALIGARLARRRRSV